MRNLIPGVPKLSGLPAPMKATMAVLGGGSIFSALYILFAGNSMALMIIIIGMVVVMLLLAAFKGLLSWSRKRKSNPLTQGIAGNAAAAPQAISEPARRARLDDLRRNFEQGIEKFRAAGKNLYSVPWYVLVGEPGSGKTEAIRHCNVGFPPGLQDQLQGAGGTLNMNWWFTNQAIIVDTAGRLMFEEVAPGTTNEWGEFLKLLKNTRPNCPINGMLLVIPVDTLIKDTADSIEKKAGKIAQQFDQIQRSLGVRFPVFIIVTKCDLLNGFREFFDDLNDPQLQHQIMGWSNPEPLDSKFDPKAVTNHLETVKKRLTDRRQQLLLDPVNTEDAQSRRIDQVDALYALPDSITKIGPRLRRYLEMIFVAGEWSPKPLFLRGIYFTSSMTEGSALDAELAEVLGVPVDSLPEGRVWRRDRAYFLRDLFIEKVFKEKGLVTRADNADKQQSRRRAIVMSCGIVALLILFALVFFGSRSLQKSIGTEKDFWAEVAKNDPKLLRVVNVKKDNTYVNDEFSIGEGINKKNTTIVKLLGDNLPVVQKRIEIPIIFRPMTLSFLGGSADTERAEAYRALYESTILYPLFVASRNKIPTLNKDTWNDDATGTLEQLMKLEYANASRSTPKDDPHPWVEVDPMFRFVLSPADYAKAKADNDDPKKAADLQAIADWVYTGDRSRAWPAPALQPGTEESRRVVNSGLDTALAYWAAQVTDQSPRMGNILRVRAALADFRAAEDNLQKLKARNVLKLDPYNQYVEDWRTAYGKLIAARDKASTEWAAASKGSPENITLTALYTAALERIAGDSQKVYANLLRLTLSEVPAGAKGDAKTLAEESVANHKKIQDSINAANEWKNGPNAKAVLADINALDDYLVTARAADGTPRRRFEVHAMLYQVADALLPRPAGAPTTAPSALVSESLAKVESDLTAAGDTIVKLVAGAPSTEPLGKAGDLAHSVVDTGARYSRYVVVTAALASMPTQPAAWENYITALAAAHADRLVRPAVPLTITDKNFQAKYSPNGVGACYDAISSIDRLCKTDPASGPKAEAASGPRLLEAEKITAQSAEIKRGLDGYLPAYRKYWQKDCFDELRFISKDWKEFAAGFVGIKEQTIRSALEEYARKAQDALKQVNDQQGNAALETEIQIGRGSGFKDECSEVLNNWKDLKDDYREVRTYILAMAPNKFLEKYVVTSARRLDSFSARYWSGLTVGALRVLANDATKDINAGLIELTKYQRFPLAPTVDKKDDLSGADLLKARTALELVKGATGVNNAGGVNSIGQGGQTKDKEVDSTLELLRGAHLLKEQQQYLDRLEKFFVALPVDARPVAVTLSVIKDKLKDPSAVSQKYAYMAITENGKELRTAYLQGLDPDKADIEYPGGDLAFLFRDVPNGPVIQTDTFPGIWSPFRLIKSPNVKVISREANKWTLEYTVTDPNKKTWSLWLLMEFKAEVPEVKEWPVPTVKTQ